MKTNIIFKTLAFTTLLITACQREVIDNENTVKKGYSLPVTVNVARQDNDDTTRATFNDGTKKLEFSTGDKLFLNGIDDTAGQFAGTLDWVSDGTFSGTITTQNVYSGTADALFGDANWAHATLLPNGYEGYGFLSINGSDYEATLQINKTYSFATSKAAGVEQFSLEQASFYSSGFTLGPQYAILYFTITGLAPSSNVAVALTGDGYNISETVTTNASGAAMFAAGVIGSTNLYNLALSVGGTLVNDTKILAAGKIYSITRNAPLTLEALTAGTIVVSSPKDGMQYSLNGGAKTDVTDGSGIDVVIGDKVAFFGNGKLIPSYYGTQFSGSADVKVYGNIMSLVDEMNYATDTELTDDWAFRGLFQYYEQMKDASGLLLPATTQTESCYYEMFADCTSLTTGPQELPATTLAKECYKSMFDGCTSLTAAPALPAETLADNCYERMFHGCTSLETAPASLPATTLAASCYYEMFSGCEKLTTSPALPAETRADYCYESMFSGCTKLTAAYVKAAYDEYDCWEMFNACTATGVLHTASGNQSSWEEAISNNGWSTWTVVGDF